MSDAPTSYDLVRYPSFAYGSTHPSHLAVLAKLSGLVPPPVETARVLELGCGEGGNLLPIAATLPQSQCLGIELAASAVSAAQEWIDELQLPNVEVQHRDLTTLDRSFGEFDYIIVYGVYSWIPPQARDRLLQVVRDHLHPQGVAYISYNVFPGWKQFGIVRDAMLFHGRHADSPAGQLRQGRDILETLAEEVPDRESAYRAIYRRAREMFAPLSDGYVFHDFLEAVNEPLYFRDFVAHARSFGLEFLANAEHAGPETLTEAQAATLGELADDTIDREQYRDFLTNRSFRETALCRNDANVKRDVDLGALDELWVASRATPVEPIAIDSLDRVELVTPEGASLSTAQPLTKAALAILAEVSPHPLQVVDLTARAAAALAAPPSSADARLLLQNLVMAYSQNIQLVQLHAWSPQVQGQVTERPRALATARIQARRELPITNVFHQRVKLEPEDRQLLALLDGTRGAAELSSKTGRSHCWVETQLVEMSTAALLVN